MSKFLAIRKRFELSASNNTQMLVSTQTAQLSSSLTIAKVHKMHFDYNVQVQFNANGGSMSQSTQSFIVGQAYGKLPTPFRNQYAFCGWFTSADGGTEVSNADIASLSITQLYAHWSAVDFSNCTEYIAVATSTYSKTGIYSATRYSSTSSIFVDWGDSNMDAVDGNINQLAHTYASPGTYNVRITDNITDIAINGNDSTWHTTTSQNRYTFKDIAKTGSHCTSMPTYAFYYCTALSSINFLSSCWTSITSLPNYAFSNCTGLTSLSSLPSRIKTLGQYCFSSCTGLSGIQDLKSTGLTSLYNVYTFSGCSNVREWKLPNSLTGTYFGAYMFYNNSQLSSMQLPSSLTSLANNCFYNNSQLKTISIPSKVTSIGSYAFGNCTALSSITYETTALTAIGSYAYYLCYSLRDITVPQTVKTIGSYAFYSCYSTYASALALPSALTSISTYAYQYCYSLKTLSIQSALTSIGDYAFAGCRLLSTIVDSRLTAQMTGANSFGNAAGTGTTTYIGYNTRGNNILCVYWAADGYSSGQWLDPLQNANKCGFNIQYIDPENALWCTVDFDARACGLIGSSRLSSMQFGQGRALGILPTPTTNVQGVVFDNWYTGIDGTGNKCTASTICPTTSSLKLYANWKYRISNGKDLSVDISNENWRLSQTQENPDPTQYFGVYESNSNHGVHNEYAKTYVKMNGIDEITLYIRSWAESVCDYTIAFNPDVDVTSNPSSSSANVKAHTNGNQKSGQALSSYTAVTYTGLDGGQHYICVVYRKDGSVNTNDDRGYLLVQHPYTYEQYDTSEDD